jgi:hypothetical protein
MNPQDSSVLALQRGPGTGGRMLAGDLGVGGIAAIETAEHEIAVRATAQRGERVLKLGARPDMEAREPAEQQAAERSSASSAGPSGA